MGYQPLPEDSPPLAFLDGVSLGADSALVIAAMWGLEDEPDRETRLLHVAGAQVRYFDFPGNITSLALTGSPDAPVVFALTKSNRIAQVFPDPDSDPETGSADRLGRSGGGRLLRLHADGATLFAVGMNGQIVRVGPDGVATEYDAGVYHEERSAYSLQLRDMAGTRAGGYLTIDALGRVFETGDGTWDVADLPVNAALEQVVSAGQPGHFWVCGDKGLLFRYGDEEIHFVDTGVRDGFWGLARYRESLYLCTFTELFRLDLASLEFGVLEPDIGFAPTFHRLDASGGGLLSVGTHDICMFDGTSWRRVRVPPNDRDESA